MSWVKVCGLTRESDVAAAVDAGADALGFVLADRSPRHIGVDRAAALMEDVPALRILVLVDAAVDEVAEAVAATGADGVQPYGADSDAAARWAGEVGLLVLRPVGRGTLSTAAIPEGQIPLLDSASGSNHGGTGITLDWQTMQRPDRPFVLAGGLSPANVAEAIAALHPWGVDASSGLESSPGIKDPARVAAFVEEAKQT